VLERARTANKIGLAHGELIKLKVIPTIRALPVGICFINWGSGNFTNSSINKHISKIKIPTTICTYPRNSIIIKLANDANMLITLKINAEPRQNKKDFFMASCFDKTSVSPI